MIRILFSFLILLLSYTSFSQQKHNTTTVKSQTPIWLLYTEKIEIPDGSERGKMTLLDTLLLVQTGTKNILRISVPTVDVRPSKEDPNTMMVDMDNVIAVSYDYLVWEIGAPLARFYNHRDSFQTATLVKTDSAIQKHLQIFPNLIKAENDSLVSSEQTKNKWIETYKTRFKPDPSYGDSTILYYERSNQPISFSLCPSEDKKPGWKLVKIRLVTNRQKDEQNRNLPEREFVFEIRRIEAVKDSVIEKRMAEKRSPSHID